MSGNKKFPRTHAGRLAADMVLRYYTHDVARDSAALTYYLLFAIFPLLIFISTLLGLLELDVAYTPPYWSRCCRQMWWMWCAHIWSTSPPTRAVSCCGSVSSSPSGSPCGPPGA